MFIQFHSVCNTIVVEGKFKYNGLEYHLTGHSGKTKKEALVNYFAAYVDSLNALQNNEEEVVAKLFGKKIEVKSETYKMPFTYMYEKPDYSQHLRLVKKVQDLVVSPYTQCLFN